jgi:hypothetical protein
MPAASRHRRPVSRFCGRSDVDRMRPQGAHVQENNKMRTGVQALTLGGCSPAGLRRRKTVSRSGGNDRGRALSAPMLFDHEVALRALDLALDQRPAGRDAHGPDDRRCVVCGGVGSPDFGVRSKTRSKSSKTPGASRPKGYECECCTPRRESGAAPQGCGIVDQAKWLSC